MATALVPPPRTDLRALQRAGLGAGVASAAVGAAVGAFSGVGADALLRAEAAMVLGTGALSGGAPWALVAGLFVHLAASFFFATLLLRLLPAMPTPPPWTGLVFGLALYLFDYYALTVLFPWFAPMRGLGAIVTHLSFGLVAALALRAVAREKLARVLAETSGEVR